MKAGLASHKERLLQLQASRDQSDKAVAAHMADRQSIARSHRAGIEAPSAGQRAADAVANFGGSWTFIGVFGLILLTWVVLNSYVLQQAGRAAFDPYPYILLNLFLSMLASIQAPVILMSQNRQAEKDRINAMHDYEVNLKAELEIMALHEKMDSLSIRQWDALIEMQREQLQWLKQLADNPRM
jgi:uncharacterized membrane protein